MGCQQIDQVHRSFVIQRVNADTSMMKKCNYVTVLVGSPANHRMVTSRIIVFFFEKVMQLVVCTMLIPRERRFFEDDTDFWLNFCFSFFLLSLVGWWNSTSFCVFLSNSSLMERTWINRFVYQIMFSVWRASNVARWAHHCSSRGTHFASYRQRGRIFQQEKWEWDCPGGVLERMSTCLSQTSTWTQRNLTEGSQISTC